MARWKQNIDEPGDLIYQISDDIWFYNRSIDLNLDKLEWMKKTGFFEDKRKDIPLLIKEFKEVQERLIRLDNIINELNLE